MVQRKCCYNSKYGYVTLRGGNIADIFGLIFNKGSEMISQVPDSTKKLVKEAVLSTGKKVATAVGDRVGMELAEKITKKKLRAAKPSRSLQIKTEADIRREVLRDLKLLPDDGNTTVGEGVKTYRRNRTKPMGKNLRILS